MALTSSLSEEVHSAKMIPVQEDNSDKRVLHRRPNLSSRHEGFARTRRAGKRVRDSVRPIHSFL